MKFDREDLSLYAFICAYVDGANFSKRQQNNWSSEETLDNVEWFAGKGNLTTMLVEEPKGRVGDDEEET